MGHPQFKQGKSEFGVWFRRFHPALLAPRKKEHGEMAWQRETDHPLAARKQRKEQGGTPSRGCPARRLLLAGPLPESTLSSRLISGLIPDEYSAPRFHSSYQTSPQSTKLSGGHSRSPVKTKKTLRKYVKICISINNSMSAVLFSVINTP